MHPLHPPPRRRRFDNRLAVEEANDAFYEAFRSGSLSAMSAIWGEGEHVQCVHPGSAVIAGRGLYRTAGSGS